MGNNSTIIQQQQHNSHNFLQAPADPSPPDDISVYSEETLQSFMSVSQISTPDKLCDQSLDYFKKKSLKSMPFNQNYNYLEPKSSNSGPASSTHQLDNVKRSEQIQARRYSQGLRKISVRHSNSNNKDIPGGSREGTLG